MTRKYTYAGLAQWAGVLRCRGINPRTGANCYEDHQKGSWADGMVHWADRERITKGGIRRFLALAAMANPVVANATPGWQQIYVQNQWIQSAARALLIKLPAHLAVYDRTRVRAAIVDLPASTELRAAAMKWSQR